MWPELWQKAENVLIVRLDNIGDMVMMTPSLKAVRQALPGAKITLMATAAGSQLSPMLPWIDDVIVHRPLWQDADGSLPFDPAREWSTVGMLQSHRFDAALIFTSFSQSPYPPAYACYLAGIPLRLGQSREFGGSVLSRWVKPLPDAAHQVDRNLFLLESEGFPVENRNMELKVPETVGALADRLLRSAGIDGDMPFIVLAPGATCAARRYDPVRFGAAVKLLCARTGLRVVITGGRNETGLAETIVDMAGGCPVFSLAGMTSVPEMAAVIGRSSLVIANHSGALHIADAFRRPLVLLFSGTDLLDQWRPRSSPVRVLGRPQECAPCYGFRCPRRMECLDVPFTEIADAAIELLRGREPGSVPAPADYAARRP